MQSTALAFFLVITGAIYGQVWQIDYSVEDQEERYKMTMLATHDSTFAWVNVYGDQQLGKDMDAMSEGEVIATAMKKVDRQEGARINNIECWHRLIPEGIVTFVETYTDSWYTVVDTVPVIDWRITDKKKQVAGHLCYQAEGTFRGREYTAWYTPDVPIASGPWKLGGLPGLILYAYSKDKRVFWKAENITKLVTKESISSYHFEAPSISYQEYFKCYDRYHQNRVKNIQTEVQQGFLHRFLGAKVSPVSMKVFHLEVPLSKTYAGK